MPRKGHPEEPMIRALRAAESGQKVGAICRELDVSPPAFYSGKRRFAGLGLTELRERRQGREENRKLKTGVADLTLDKPLLQQVLPKKLTAGRPSTAGERDRAAIPREGKACLGGDRDHPLEQPAPESAGSTKRVAPASAGTSREPSSRRFSTMNGAPPTGRLDSQ